MSKHLRDNHSVSLPVLFVDRDNDGYRDIAAKLIGILPRCGIAYDVDGMAWEIFGDVVEGEYLHNYTVNVMNAAALELSHLLDLMARHSYITSEYAGDHTSGVCYDEIRLPELLDTHRFADWELQLMSS